MKSRLLFENKDFDWRWALQAAAKRETSRPGRGYQRLAQFDDQSGLPWNAEMITADLALETVLGQMAEGDDSIFEVARKVLLDGVKGDLDTIHYRQAVLQDCLSQPSVLHELYAVAVEARDKQKPHYLGVLTRYPNWVLHDAIEAMGVFLHLLRKLRTIADLHAHRFVSKGWKCFFESLKRDLDDGNLRLVEDHLEELKLRNGAVISAELGKANKGCHYMLHRLPFSKQTWSGWLKGFFDDKPPGFRFELHPRDEAGAQALASLRNRGISLAATALGKSAEHVRDFFSALRMELAFYVGCVNLHDALSQKAEPTCMPAPTSAGQNRLSFRGLYDVGLTLSVDQRVVGNDVNADTNALVIITGPNTGGKSTFLRSVGLAQLMMQAGMFVPAESFCSSLCNGLFTHYKREEDAGMESGKFDEELRRMSQIVDHIEPYSMVLFNESFASTNEREGSEIARQIIAALVETRASIFFVTHMYELAHGLYDSKIGSALFLRAGRNTDGARTFKLAEGEPLRISFGEDLYGKIFADNENLEGARNLNGAKAVLRQRG